jgi:3-deoxy-manno-octulosonate cytidylyltransferase (CMP-KDO synthetase)
VRALGVIPARFASTRFPGKPLAPLGNRTLVEEVWSRTRSARRLARVIVATEDERIARACASFGAEAMLTSADHASGTDRVAEVAERAGAEFDVVLNVQGDEPFVTGTAIDRLVEAFEKDPGTEMATLAEPFDAVEDLFDPNQVKIAQAADGRALYFSRSPIPYHRVAAGKLALDFSASLAMRPGGLGGYRKHQGIYAYRRDVLFRLTKLPPSPLEIDEGLEQLRALENGVSIRVLDSDFRSVAVDTPGDLERVKALGLAAKEARA